MDDWKTGDRFKIGTVEFEIIGVPAECSRFPSRARDEHGYTHYILLESPLVEKIEPPEIIEEGVPYLDADGDVWTFKDSGFSMHAFRPGDMCGYYFGCPKRPLRKLVPEEK